MRNVSGGSMTTDSPRTIVEAKPPHPPDTFWLPLMRTIFGTALKEILLPKNTSIGEGKLFYKFRSFYY